LKFVTRLSPDFTPTPLLTHLEIGKKKKKKKKKKENVVDLHVNFGLRSQQKQDMSTLFPTGPLWDGRIRPIDWQKTSHPCLENDCLGFTVSNSIGFGPSFDS